MRKYDDEIGRFTSIDPLWELYRRFTPYQYGGNNPLIIKDPTGKILEVAQEEGQSDEDFADFKREFLKRLQKLTNDQLIWKGNKVAILKQDKMNKDKQLTAGTKLIRALISDSYTTTVKKGSGPNHTVAADRAAGSLKKDGSRNIGTDVTVYWDPTNKTGGINVEGSRNRPVEIGLAHELIHADYLNNGEHDDSRSGTVDPEGSSINLYHYFNTNELQTRVRENEIRFEQGVPLRLVPEEVR